MLLPDLATLLEYKHPAVLQLYKQNYPNNRLTAEIAFTETLKYLWLAQKHALEGADFECFMPRSMREIDEMWHEFILFTKDYCDFCTKYFGEYLHHAPNIFDYFPRYRADVEADVEKLLHYIMINLGEDSVRIWFADYLNPLEYA